MGHNQLQVFKYSDRSRWNCIGSMYTRVRYMYRNNVIQMHTHTHTHLSCPEYCKLMKFRCTHTLMHTHTHTQTPMHTHITRHTHTHSEKFLFSGSVDHSIKKWDMDTLEVVATIAAHENPVSSLTINGSRLYSGSLKSIKVPS